MPNYITSLRDENAALRSALKTWEDSANAFRAFLASPKFCGVASDGSRKDWIAVSDVSNWLRDVQSAIASEVPPARPVKLAAVNLDGFSSSAELFALLPQLSGKTPAAVYRYAENKASAMGARESGNITLALQLEATCERIYAEIPSAWKW